jgi:hypothetical protein
MKPKAITFLYHDSALQKAHLVQRKTLCRTVRESWEETMRFLEKHWGMEDQFATANRFSMICAFKGLISWMDETEPLRKSTEEELKSIVKESIA